MAGQEMGLSGGLIRGGGVKIEASEVKVDGVAGLRSQRYFVPTSRRSPRRLSSRFSRRRTRSTPPLRCSAR